MCSVILEREEGREGEGGERETNIDVTEIHLSWLPPVGAPTGNRTCTHLVYGTMLQPTEPHVQGLISIFANVPLVPIPRALKTAYFHSFISNV